MALNLVNQLGEWNPQLFREFKGRLKPRNILIAVTTSLLGQILVLMSFGGRLPVADAINPQPLRNIFCTGPRKDYELPLCFADGLGGFVINWELWWQRVFVWISIFSIFALLVVGTYILISDLSKEERQGTLNFLRLTPGSTKSILGGKLLGVPILLYLGVALALPLHLFAGLAGNVPGVEILGFYTVLVTSCLFFYSLALLFGLVGNWLSGFQAWLGSGAVLMFLFITLNVINYNGIGNRPTDWLTLFNPAMLLPYLVDDGNFLNPERTYDSSRGFLDWLWFYLPIGAKAWTASGFAVLNYGLWSYWIWQGLDRCFHNPSATLLSKRQSYGLTACFEVVLLGFAMSPEVTSWRNHPAGLFENFQWVLGFNLVLFLSLIAALSPQRQAMQDWARYRHQQRSARKGGMVRNLIWGKNSPAPIAVVLNLAIAFTILLPWILLWPASEYKIPALWGLLLHGSLIIFYATVVQLMLLMKTPKRSAWAAAAVAGFVTLPPIIFGLLSVSISEEPAVWLFSAFPWASVQYATETTMLVALVSQSLALVMLNLQLTRQLRQAGESSTKALLSGRSPVAIP
ncbi:MAG TPA: ABC transporter permease [Cyanobacteria bacterium UBA8803]|nr:ABC transporter permease [Cyanobacteria bacterium UBA9273]HBL60305.1 ABC transporter permease [Cyanobacteria bacterium UBA8803]